MASSVTLYEGNFSEWRAFISQRLSARGYSNVLATFGKAPSTVTPRNYLRYKQIANSMLKTVHTSLRERVKGKDARVPWLLLEALQKIARPSRFMDLPPELRENVITTQRGLSAITKVSSTLRQETLARAYQNTIFVLDGTEDQRVRSDGATPEGSVFQRPWLVSSLRKAHFWWEGNLRHLRTVHVRCCDRHYIPAAMEICHSPSSGITIVIRSEFLRCSAKVLAKVEALATKPELSDAKNCDGRMLAAIVQEAVDILAADDTARAY